MKTFQDIEIMNQVLNRFIEGKNNNYHLFKIITGVFYIYPEYSNYVLSVKIETNDKMLHLLRIQHNDRKGVIENIHDYVMKECPEILI